jgi:hypothetical protein
MSDKQIRLDRDVREALCNLIEGAIRDDESRKNLEILQQAILIKGFFTDDNQKAIDDLRFSQGRDYSRSWGLCVGDPGVLLSDIVHLLEEERIPDCVATKHPHLTQREWESAMRIVMMILSSFEL